MDEERMSIFSLAACLAGGTALGICYFQALWWNARLFARGGRTITAIALAIGRIVVLGGLLALASLQGAAVLLVTAMGVLLGRLIVIRALRQVGP
jgi:F1F0 ATPase subunit 2